MRIVSMTQLGNSCLSTQLQNWFVQYLGMLLVYYKIINPDQHSEKVALAFYIPMLISSLLYQINDLA